MIEKCLGKNKAECLRMRALEANLALYLISLIFPHSLLSTIKPSLLDINCTITKYIKITVVIKFFKNALFSSIDNMVGQILNIYNGKS